MNQKIIAVIALFALIPAGTGFADIESTATATSEQITVLNPGLTTIEASKINTMPANLITQSFLHYGPFVPGQVQVWQDRHISGYLHDGYYTISMVREALKDVSRRGFKYREISIPRKNVNKVLKDDILKPPPGVDANEPGIWLLHELDRITHHKIMIDCESMYTINLKGKKKFSLLESELRALERAILAGGDLAIVYLAMNTGMRTDAFGLPFSFVSASPDKAVAGGIGPSWGKTHGSGINSVVDMEVLKEKDIPIAERVAPPVEALYARWAVEKPKKADMPSRMQRTLDSIDYSLKLLAGRTEGTTGTPVGAANPNPGPMELKKDGLLNKE